MTEAPARERGTHVPDHPRPQNQPARNPHRRRHRSRREHPRHRQMRQRAITKHRPFA